MTFPKLLGLIVIFLFGTITLTAVVKGCGNDRARTSDEKSLPVPIEVELEEEFQPVASPVVPSPPPPLSPPSPPLPVQPQPSSSQQTSLPNANRIQELFNVTGPKLPIVETIAYKSRVPWQKGRSAWLSDYARYYHTSRHFIARSLRGKPNYTDQEVAEGNRFNVYRLDKEIRFHLLVDLTRCRMWLYYDDLAARERVLLKSYPVGIGRQDETKPSGYLTPCGVYTLGSKVAIYKPKAMGMHKGQSVEMVRLFGTRWIPFDKELAECTAPAKGFGIHGVPWIETSKGELVEDIESLGCYQSDGCIRLAREDIEEIFAIIITKPAVIEVVKDFYSAAQPSWK